MHHPTGAFAASWDELSPSSFKTTLYVPSLKISITPGSFILYRNGVQPLSSATLPSREGNNKEQQLTPMNELEDHQGVHSLKKLPTSVGRIIQVVDSVEEIDNHQEAHFCDF
ncbi:hypothetical protein MHU86_8824 [Fragilaria crotonensis]|nr:hypothetical protein MHU86_8824 [Fragilaria crotonensis]